MRRRKLLYSTAFIAAWVVLLLDQTSKAWALASLEGKSDREILGSFLRFTFTRNSGAAFSFAPSGSQFLSVFALAVLFAIIFWIKKITSQGWALVLGLVAGGILGNLSDRVFRSSSGAFRGEVIDYIALPHWPVFNIADSAIVVAAGFALLLSFRNISPISTIKEDPINENDLDGKSETKDGA